MDASLGMTAQDGANGRTACALTLCCTVVSEGLHPVEPQAPKSSPQTAAARWRMLLLFAACS
jgi:hypothetical protein